MDARLEQVILSVFERIDCCKHYNQCMGSCKGCFFEKEHFSFKDELTSNSQNLLEIKKNSNQHKQLTISQLYKKWYKEIKEIKDVPGIETINEFIKWVEKQ